MNQPGKASRLIILIVLVFFAVVSFKNQKIYASYLREVNEKRITWDAMRFKTVATEKVMEILAIKPGMTILDIGTGTGPFAYEFAARLKGTGRVFATDIDRDCVAHVKMQAERMGLANLHPVLVKEEGLDKFYSRNRYDLITIFHTYISGADYYKKLRNFLAENGRLVFILRKKVPPFSTDDVVDFSGLARELSSGPVDSPFYKSLSRTTRTMLSQNSNFGSNEDLNRGIIADFNAILSDNYFAAYFAEGSSLNKELAFSADEREYANLLLLFIVDEGILHKNKKILGRKDKQVVRPLNKLILIQKFREYLRPERMFSSAFSRDRVSLFQEAGYKLESEYQDVLSFEDILVFVSDKNAEDK